MKPGLTFSADLAARSGARRAKEVDVRLWQALAEFRTDQRAVTVLEYALIAALIFCVIAATVGTVGISARDAYQAAVNGFR